jgi:ABC-type Zn uptake system ZnuABC Zn-binding protein ZnuA
MVYKGKLFLAFLFFCGVFVFGCGIRDESIDVSGPSFAVANSYLEAVVKDVRGVDEEVMMLVPPGMCPGHFDMSPGQVSDLLGCEVLFVFDFQKNISESVPRIKDRGLRVVDVSPGGGLCVPATYISVVEQVCESLASGGESVGSDFSDGYYVDRLGAIRGRINKIGANAKARVAGAGLSGEAVLCSGHQKVFLEWLGFEVAATFPGRDTVTPSKIDGVLKKGRQEGVELVVGNSQEGSELAEAVGEQLDARVVILSNFPICGSGFGEGEGEYCRAFDRLIYENVERLLGSDVKVGDGLAAGAVKIESCKTGVFR